MQEGHESASMMAGNSMVQPPWWRGTMICNTQ